MIWQILMNYKIPFFFYYLWQREVLTRSRVAISWDCRDRCLSVLYIISISKISILFFTGWQKWPLLIKSLSFSSSHQIHQRFKALFLSFLKDIWKATEAFKPSPSTSGKGESKLQLQNPLIATSALCCHPKSIPENGQGWSNLVIHSLSAMTCRKADGESMFRALIWACKPR